MPAWHIPINIWNHCEQCMFPIVNYAMNKIIIPDGNFSKYYMKLIVFSSLYKKYFSEETNVWWFSVISRFEIFEKQGLYVDHFSLAKLKE